MANELTVTSNIQAAKNGASITPGAKIKQITMSGTHMQSLVQDIGTSAELIDFNDISGAPEYVRITNLDSTNYVELGGDSGLTVFKHKLKPGYFAQFPPSSATLYAKANTATCQVQVDAVEA